MKILIIIFISFSFNIETSAHDGGLNKNGCHKNRKNGDYHCHQRSSFSQQEVFTGIPKITDGDTLKIGRTRIRLHGIDAPESNQFCSFEGREWRCGWESTNALANIIGKHWVTCIKRDEDRFGRVIAVCKAGPININEWMVSNGWAVAYRRYSLDYVFAEKKSKAAGKGLWRGKFIMPWDWRRSR
ncbi:MAG: thermonuclease family protein [Pseudomonadota bacterium]|nr:thermonuclease family protein [Pseudomonadota bacterium]